MWMLQGSSVKQGGEFGVLLLGLFIKNIHGLFVARMHFQGRPAS
jgi:hypothetical protein